MYSIFKMYFFWTPIWAYLVRMPKNFFFFFYYNHLNHILLQIVITLEIYGVKKIVGIPFGYRGFSAKELNEMPVCNLSFVIF